MSVYTDSRYAGSPQIKVKDTRNDADTDRPFIYTENKLPPNAEISDLHLVQTGDRLDRLAHFYAGDSTKWWVIAEVNNIFGFPLFLRPGTTLKIPTREVFTRARRAV